MLCECPLLAIKQACKTSKVTTRVDRDYKLLELIHNAAYRKLTSQRDVPTEFIEVDRKFRAVR